MKKNGKIILFAVLLAALFMAFAGCGKQTPEQQTLTIITPGAEKTSAPTKAPEKTSVPAETQEDASAAAEEFEITPEPAQESSAVTVSENAEYSDKDHVALYLHTYGHLPSNYLTKSEAKRAGWVASKGNLYEVLPGMSIGGDRYTNYEGSLPDAKGRKYFECDINYNPKGKTSGKVTRGPERIVYSNDGLIFYTGDHYETFEQLY